MIWIILSKIADCNVCKKSKKATRQPVVAITLAKVLNETIAMNLKYWSDDTKTWFSHTVYHVTQYSVSCVARSKRKEAILKKNL